MDLKGISWAGNIYEKFEAMCLEMEEVIYEDTMKYMENQVQKVGASVKKFYSEVMQDLLPPSCIDPVNVATVHDDVYKKSLRVLKKKEITNEIIHDLISEESSPCPSPTGYVESTGSVLCSVKSNKVGLQRRSIGIKRISKADLPPRTYSPITISSEDMSKSTVHDTRLTCTADKNATGSTMLDPKDERPGNISVSDTLEIPVASDNKLSTEPLRLEKDNSDCTSSFNGSGVKDTSFSASNEDKLMKDGDTCGIESFGDEVFVSYEESFDMELVNNEDVAESVEESKLEDACILVESDLLHFVPDEAKKTQQCKKKLSEAESPKLRPKRNQNDADGVILDRTNNSNSVNVPAQNSFGSDWELI